MLSWKVPQRLCCLFAYHSPSLPACWAVRSLLHAAAALPGWHQAGVQGVSPLCCCSRMQRLLAAAGRLLPAMTLLQPVVAPSVLSWAASSPLYSAKAITAETAPSDDAYAPTLFVGSMPTHGALS